MKILITGATGYVGSNLFKEIQYDNFEISLLVRPDSIIPSIEEVTIISLSDPDWKEQVRNSDFQVVLHLASYLTSSDESDAISSLLDANIFFGTHLLDALKGSALKTFINTGTFAEYENSRLRPAYLYAATKTAFRSILHYYSNRYNFNVINIIPFTVYGGIDTKKKLIDLIFESTTSIEPIKMSPGDQMLDFVHISDVVSFYRHLLRNLDKLKNRQYHEVDLGTGKGYTPRQIASIMEKYTSQTNITWGGVPYRPTDTMSAVARNLDLMSILEWTPKIDIEEGIKLYLSTIKQN